MKKTAALLLTLILCASCLFADGFSFVFDDFDMHDEVLNGLCPTYLVIGGKYTIDDLVDAGSSSATLTAGGGYKQYDYYCAPNTKFDTTRITELFNITLTQNLLEEKLAVSAGFGMQWMQDKDRTFNETYTTLSLGASYGDFTEDLYKIDGFGAELLFETQPEALNGRDTYYSLSALGTYSATVFQELDRDGFNKATVIVTPSVKAALNSKRIPLSKLALAADYKINGYEGQRFSTITAVAEVEAKVRFLDLGKYIDGIKGSPLYGALKISAGYAGGKTLSVGLVPGGVDCSDLFVSATASVGVKVADILELELCAFIDRLNGGNYKFPGKNWNIKVLSLLTF